MYECSIHPYFITETFVTGIAVKETKNESKLKDNNFAVAVGFVGQSNGASFSFATFQEDGEDIKFPEGNEFWALYDDDNQETWVNDFLQLFR